MDSFDPKRALAWNCRGMGGPSTISQLKGSIRLYVLNIIFVCETKQSKSFMGTVCKNLRLGERWIVKDPVGRKGGMLVAWSTNVEIKVMRSTGFCMELYVKTEDERECFRAIFVHATVDAKERKEQWEELKERRKVWGG